MNIDVEITDTASGDTVVYHDDFDYEGWHNPERSPSYQVRFSYSEGNFACDCNRFILYTLAKTGLAPDDEEDIACGNSRFKIKIRERTSGEVIFSDYEEQC